MWFCVLLYFKNVLLLKENIVDNHRRVLRSAQAVSEKMGDSFSKFPSPDPMHINNGICPPGPCSQYNQFPCPNCLSLWVYFSSSCSSSSYFWWDLTSPGISVVVLENMFILLQCGMLSINAFPRVLHPAKGRCQCEWSGCVQFEVQCSYQAVRWECSSVSFLSVFHSTSGLL